MLVNMDSFMNYVGHDKDLMYDVIDIFFNEGKASLAEIESLVTKGDSINAGKWSHKYKGSAAVFGCERITSLAKEMELKGKAGDLQFVKTHLFDLKKLHDELILELQEIKKQKPN